MLRGSAGTTCGTFFRTSFKMEHLTVSFLLPLNDLCQFADHYCHWFLELSSRIGDATTGYTFTPCMGSFTFPDIDTR